MSTNAESLVNHFRSTLSFIDGPMTVFDPASRCHLILGTPDSLPDIWTRYLDQARAIYAGHGVSSALDYDEVIDGHNTTLFYVAADESGAIRGGHRAQGPYIDVGQSHALVEWDGFASRDALVESIASRLPHGVVEMKTAWVDPTADDPSAVSALLARVAVPTMAMTGARFIMATAAEHVLRRWATSGGRVDTQVSPARYPDERYRTSLMWWDRETMAELSEPAVWQKICDEARIWSGGARSFGQRSVA